MMKWVNTLFAKRKPGLESQTPVAAPVMAAPKPPARQENPSTPPEFLEAILKFGLEDFSSSEKSGEPHRLQAVTMTRDNYLHQYFSTTHNILKSVYYESELYTSPPDYEWSRVRPAVSAYISAQDPATAAAFDTFLRYCKKYSKSVEDTAAGDDGFRNITVAQHAFSNAEAAELKDALEKIWKVMPDSDPRVVEGMDYVMASRPAIAEAFSGYCWTKNDHRSDFETAGKIKSVWTQGTLRPGQTAAIARQSAENLALLKPFSREIAEKTLGWCLSRLLVLDADWRLMDQGRATARVILDALAGGAAPDKLAQDIQSGVYGTPKTGDAVSEDTRKRSQKAMGAVCDVVALAEDIRSGAWFDAERARLLQMAEEVLWTPEFKAQKEREIQDAAVEKMAEDATVLETPVHVGTALRLKRNQPASP